MTRMESNNSSRTYTPKPNTVASYILEDLGYCCLQEFFIRYPDNGDIAVRLGVLVKSVREVRKKVAAGLGHCDGNCNCLKRKKK